MTILSVPLLQRQQLTGLRCSSPPTPTVVRDCPPSAITALHLVVMQQPPLLPQHCHWSQPHPESQCTPERSKNIQECPKMSKDLQGYPGPGRSSPGTTANTATLPPLPLRPLLPRQTGREQWRLPPLTSSQPGILESKKALIRLGRGSPSWEWGCQCSSQPQKTPTSQKATHI